MSRYKIGDTVKTKKKIRNDGTFPGLDWDAMLLEKGEVGVILDTGTFLLTKTVYTVYFPRLGIFVGCLEHELEAIDEDEEAGSV